LNIYLFGSIEQDILNVDFQPNVFSSFFEIFLAMHKCVKIEPFFRHYFHTCEAFLLNIPQHGLYNFAYSDNRDDVVLSVIVEATIAVRKKKSFFILIIRFCFLINRNIVLHLMNKIYSNQIQ